MRLARPAEDITVGAVVRAMEARNDLVECFDIASDTCVISPACRLKSILGSAQEAFLKELDAYSLADVIRGPAALEALLGFQPLATAG